MQPQQSGSFPCTVPGCNKVFGRKNHLNRHLEAFNHDRFRIVQPTKLQGESTTYSGVDGDDTDSAEEFQQDYDDDDEVFEGDHTALISADDEDDDDDDLQVVEAPVDVSMEEAPSEHDPNRNTFNQSVFDSVVCKAYAHQHVPEDYMHTWLH
ncbi:C2H2-type zinc finger transcription factor [Mucor lusitanicus]|uniref:C2H2-type zinc finger transcription factor n=2 Tax=Mucor circinelloides f. lusitanicus TaxID=29924 RepID=A0A168M9W1_MUCCL|nr:C2H2-type zinc finger transcription factor [Mucor lusitanicus]OAD04606.1 C2H2-type zinc finger transcription factor [Mucor lusitanicus CBS 277.49]